MSAKRKRRQRYSKTASPSAAVSREDSRVQIAHAVAAGRGRLAWTLARELEKADDFSAADIPLIWNALECRGREMLKDGHPAEAWQLFEAAQTRLPGLSRFVTRAFTWSMHVAGDGTMPVELQDADCLQDESVVADLLVAIQDPAVFSEHPELAGTHPLKQQAEIIISAWDTLTDTGSLPSMADISRRSPFAGWRLFLQALAAFYAGQNEQARKFLKKIEPQWGAAKAGNLLVQVLDSEKARNHDVKVLVDALSPKDSPAQLLEDLKKVYRRNPGMAFKKLNQICLHFENLGFPEVAYALLALFPECEPEIDDEYDAFSFWDAHGQHCDCVLRNFFCLYSEDTKEIEEDYFSPLEKALIYAEDATREELHDEDDTIGLYTRSIQAKPLESTFKKAVRWSRKFEQDKFYLKLLDLWRKSFPQAAEPRRLLLEENWGRAPVARVYAEFRECERLLGSHAEFCREMRPLIVAEAVVAGIESLSDEKIMAELAAFPEGELLKRCVLYASAAKSARKALVAGLQELESAFLVRHCLCSLLGERVSFIPPALRLGAGTESFRDLCRQLVQLRHFKARHWRKLSANAWGSQKRIGEFPDIIEGLRVLLDAAPKMFMDNAPEVTEFLWVAVTAAVKNCRVSAGGTDALAFRALMLGGLAIHEGLHERNVIRDYVQELISVAQSLSRYRNPDASRACAQIEKLLASAFAIPKGGVVRLLPECKDVLQREQKLTGTLEASLEKLRKRARDDFFARTLPPYPDDDFDDDDDDDDDDDFEYDYPFDSADDFGFGDDDDGNDDDCGDDESIDFEGYFGDDVDLFRALVNLCVFIKKLEPELGREGARKYFADQFGAELLNILPPDDDPIWNELPDLEDIHGHGGSDFSPFGASSKRSAGKRKSGSKKKKRKKGRR